MPQSQFWFRSSRTSPDDAAFQELLLAFEVEQRLGMPHLQFGEGPAGRLDLGLGQRKIRTLGRVVETRQDLTLLNDHPFLDEHLDNLAGDLRGDGRLTAGRHVARRVEHRWLSVAGRCLADHRGVNGENLGFRPPLPGGCPAADQRDEQHHHQERPLQGGTPLAGTVDLEIV